MCFPKRHFTSAPPAALPFSRLRASLARSRLAGFTMMRSQFGEFRFGAMPVWHVSHFCAYADPVSIFAHFCFLQRSVVCTTLARISFLRIFLPVSYCLLHIFINLINVSSGLHHSELVYRRCFCVWSIMLLITYTTLHHAIMSVARMFV